VASDKTTPPQSGAAVTAKEGRALLSLIQRAAEAAAHVIRDATPRRDALNWEEKGPADFVTEVDKNAEGMAMEIILMNEPQAKFIAEESSGSKPLSAVISPLTFVIDPLDGTTNFLHGLPEYAVSIGAMVNGKLAAGIVLNVPRDEHFTAISGQGAWLGDEQIHVSKIENPQRALIGTGFPFKTPSDIPDYLPQMARVMEATSGIRRPGAASIDLACVAAGRLDGFWENFLSPWDVAAGILLIREAGGICSDTAGRDSEVNFGAIVAGNPAIHSWLLRTLHNRPNR
jgi:myo-inositol-1(or 4)-monophosphatase